MVLGLSLPAFTMLHVIISLIAIVALARKLMVALWRYLETGLVPTGAVMRPSF